PITIVPRQPLGASNSPHWGSTANRHRGEPWPGVEPQTVISMSIDRDHHIGGLDHGGGRLADRELELIHGFIGDRGGDDGAAAEVDANVSGRLPLLHLDDLALENVARAELHGDLPVALISVDVSLHVPPALTARRWPVEQGLEFGALGSIGRTRGRSGPQTLTVILKWPGYDSRALLR